ncbi:MAG: 3-phosphoserine/phosphohydroxythreonine transaminase [Gammaproteobacteria bacterium]|nr:3-phosphoserine/phosphohydroxythreonine transaminase [Gammaproteobacteria bacterium]
MGRIFNFSAGPATLPVEVLEQARSEMLDWQGRGVSVMEVSHRSKAFIKVAEQAEADLRELLAIPADYAVLFLQGGATQQFAQIPMNLAAAGDTVDYLVTGQWSKKAASEAKLVRKVNVVADGAAGNYTDAPDRSQWKLTPGAAYLHYCPNETIGGLEFHAVPDAGGAPLVADMSSTILSRPVDVSRFGMIYAGAQKNIGPAGLVVMIVRRDLIDRVPDTVPNILRYSAQAKEGSMLNTPPTFSWYFAGLVFAWLRKQGGLDRMAEINRRKADKLYRAIDGSGFYRNPVAVAYRSWMNVPFTLPREELDAPFLSGAEKAGLTELKGHRSVGGMRASIYNAMPEAGVDALIGFMADFAKRHG